MSATYLDVSSAQGAQRFGPVAGTIQVGADPQQCQVAVSGAGVAPVHAIITDHGDGRYTVQPVQANLVVLLQSGGQTHPVQPTATAQAGDTILLGGTSGPQIRLHRDAGQVATAGGAASGGVAQAAGAAGAAGGWNAANRRMQRQGGFAGAMGQEAKRQMFSRLLARNPYFARLYHQSFRFRSGAMLQPRNLIAMGGGLIVLVGGALASCGGLVGMYLWGN